MVEVEERAKNNEGHIHRLRKCLLKNVGELLLDDKDEDSSGDDGATTDRPDTDEEEDKKVSPTQMARLYSQTVAVLDLLVAEHARTAFSANVRNLDAPSSPAQIKAIKNVAKEAIEQASLLRLNNSLLLIAESVCEKAE